MAPSGLSHLTIHFIKVCHLSSKHHPRLKEAIGNPEKIRLAEQFWFPDQLWAFANRNPFSQIPSPPPQSSLSASDAFNIIACHMNMLELESLECIYRILCTLCTPVLYHPWFINIQKLSLR